MYAFSVVPQYDKTLKISHSCPVLSTAAAAAPAAAAAQSYEGRTLWQLAHVQHMQIHVHGHVHAHVNTSSAGAVPSARFQFMPGRV